MMLTVTVLARPSCSDDDAFQSTLFAQTRGAEFAAAGLERAALDQLLALQRHAQEQQRTAEHPNASTAILEVDGRQCGTIVLDRSAGSIHVVDIAVTPQAQGRGIGTTMLRRLFAEADETGRDVTLDVWALNHGAVALYLRLGFEVVAERSGYVAMRRGPQA